MASAGPDRRHASRRAGVPITIIVRRRRCRRPRAQLDAPTRRPAPPGRSRTSTRGRGCGRSAARPGGCASPLTTPGVSSPLATRAAAPRRGRRAPSGPADSSMCRARRRACASPSGDLTSRSRGLRVRVPGAGGSSAASTSRCHRSAGPTVRGRRVERPDLLSVSCPDGVVLHAHPIHWAAACARRHPGPSPAGRAPAPRRPDSSTGRSRALTGTGA